MECGCTGQESVAGAVSRPSGTGRSTQLLRADAAANTPHPAVGCQPQSRQVRYTTIRCVIFMMRSKAERVSKYCIIIR